MNKKKPELSIIILNFNTQDLLKNCLNSLEKVKDEVSFETIVIDNASADSSVEMVRKFIKNSHIQLQLVTSSINRGFAAGNNLAAKVCEGKYVLFLNSDTEVKKNTLRSTVNYLEENPQVGAITCKTVLPNGQLDRDARRRFPTPLVSFQRLFLGNGKAYWYGDVSPEKIQEVDVIQGAYFLSPKKVLDKVKWFDEDYFLDGEDIDLCWKIKEAGYKIIYYPEVSILHIKKASKQKFRSSSVASGVRAMELFYRKRLWNNYPVYVNYIVIIGINFMKILRAIKVFFSK